MTTESEARSKIYSLWFESWKKALENDGFYYHRFVDTDSYKDLVNVIGGRGSREEFLIYQSAKTEAELLKK